ncbi:MAG: DsbA family protein [Gammaproteobacteria bacterium]|nr:DsbA family protein [Gammaproteobacteria bacterium]
MVKLKLLVLLASFSGLFLSAVKADTYWQIQHEKLVASDNLYFSWLGCHSCLMIEQKVDLSGFEQLPLIARPEWRAAAKIQMAMQMLSLDEATVDAFKQEIIQQKVDVKDLNNMIESLISLGVEQEPLIETLNSRELFSRIQQAQDKAKQYQVRYVPTAVVKGQYAVDAKSTASVAAFAETLEELKRK